MNHNQSISLFAITAILLGLVLTLSNTEAFALSDSHIAITNPAPNGIVSNGFQVTGTYSSILKTPRILIEINNSNYTATVSNGVFSYKTSLSDGTYNLIVYVLDSTTTYRSSIQFNQISHHILTPKYAIIVPFYSETCQRMISMNDYSECPPLKELMSADTSNQNIAGHFVMKKDGTYIREKPQVKNYYQFATNMSDKKVCVECFIDLSLNNVIQQVIIEPTGFSYTTHDYGTDVITNTVTDQNNVDTSQTIRTNQNFAGIVVYHDWYADPTCSTVTIDYSPERYADAIAYLKSGCTSHAYNSTTITEIPNHAFEMHSPYSSLAHDAYMQSIFHGHKQLTNEHTPTGGGLGPGNCIGKTICPYTDPYKKQGY